MRLNNFLLLILSFTLFACCNATNSNSDEQTKVKNTHEKVNQDSIELTNLVRQVYEWHMTKRINDFPYKYENPSDTIFIGIDWDIYNRNVEILKNTQFFTDDFLSFHKSIALTIDSSMKKADIKWRNINDGIPIWDTDADDWCGCQGYPDNYWEIITLDSLKIGIDYASFNWTWDTVPTEYPHYYKITSRKIENKWKINWMEGFKYYGTVKDYDDVLKEE
jgi:hypothetical protein